MLLYIGQRALLACLTFVLVTMVIFGAVRALPGDAVLAAFEDSGGGATEEYLAAVREDMGLNRPFYVQYFTWLGDVLQGDFGKSFISRQDVSVPLRQALPVTLELTGLAVVFAVVMSVPLGVLGALTRGSFIDYGTRMIAVIGMTIPNFVFGMVALLIGVRWFGWLPPISYRPITEDPISNLTQFILPAVILGTSLAAGLTRFTRSAVLEVLQKDYVRTARAKGLGGRAVISRHVLRNSLIPVITVLGLQVSAVIGGTIVVEQIFNLPGVGRMLVTGVAKRDYPEVQAGVTVVALGVILVNLLVDISYGLLDPRIRYG